MDNPDKKRGEARPADALALHASRLSRMRQHFLLLLLGLDRCREEDADAIAVGGAFMRERPVGRGAMDLGNARRGLVRTALGLVRRHVFEMLQVARRTVGSHSVGGTPPSEESAAQRLPSRLFASLYGEREHAGAFRAALLSIERLELKLNRYSGEGKKNSPQRVELFLLEPDRAEESSASVSRIRPRKTELDLGEPTDLNRRVLEGIFFTAFLSVAAVLRSGLQSSPDSDGAGGNPV